MTPYNPVCESCHSRPKMDGCGICEECWYGSSAELIAREREDRSAWARIASDLEVEAAWSWHMGPDR